MRLASSNSVERKRHAEVWPAQGTHYQSNRPAIGHELKGVVYFKRTAREVSVLSKESQRNDVDGMAERAVHEPTIYLPPSANSEVLTPHPKFNIARDSHVAR